MRVSTVWRWAAGPVAACVLIALALVPFIQSAPHNWMPEPPAPLAAELRRLTEAAGQAHAAVRAYRGSQALDRWTAASARGDTVAVRVDPSVPASIGGEVRMIASAQWSTLGAGATAAHAEVFVYVDSSTIPRAADVGVSRRVLEPRRLVDLAFALPEATDGQRCVTLVRLRGTSPAHVAAMRSQPLAGVCGFFAAFGLPGDGVRSWLVASNYRFARRSDWAVARAPATDASSLYGLSETAGRCLAGEGRACFDALRPASAKRTAGRRPRHEWLLDVVAPVSVAAPGVPSASLGEAEGAFLADAVRNVGADRFARFWAGSGMPEAAFLAGTGVTMESWTRRWLTRTYGPLPSRPTVRWRHVIWLAIASPLLLVFAARPRERVLAERVFAG